jgi:hypothetical protein
MTLLNEGRIVCSGREMPSFPSIRIVAQYWTKGRIGDNVHGCMSPAQLRPHSAGSVRARC